MNFELAFLYVQHCRDVAADEALDLALGAVLEAGRAAWPEIDLRTDVFVAHIAGCAGADRQAVSAINAADVFLACACKERIAAAVAAFDRAYLARVPEFLARMRVAPDFCDDVRQILGEKLLVSAAGSPPKIADYSGRASLAAWVRIAAVRTALDLKRRRSEEPEEDGAEVEKILGAHVSPELALIRRQFEREFKDALRAGFAALGSDQRLVLYLQSVKGKTGDEIASTLQIHRATVVRWIARARQDILREATRHLQAHVPGSPSELESVIAVLRSHVDLSFSQLLGGDAV